jgi:hypothetical protein
MPVSVQVVATMTPAQLAPTVRGVPLDAL